jgi:hypothetical protein
MNENDTFVWIQLKNCDGEARILRPRDTTSIARIHSGWLIKFTHFHGKSSSLTSQAMAFVPDLSHEWHPELDSQRWERLSRKANVNYGDTTDRLRVWQGWVYKNCFFNGNEEMHISIIFVPGDTDRSDESENGIR